MPNRWKEAIFWMLFSMVAILFIVPISLIYLVIFLPYRLVTWPFRLARSWLLLRAAERPRGAAQARRDHEPARPEAIRQYRPRPWTW